MCVALASLVLGTVLLHAVGAPWDLVKIIIINATGLAVLTVITAWWLISAHTAMSAATVTILLRMLGPVAAVLVPVPFATGWSRLHLRAHSAAQVVVGALVGMVLGGGLYVLLLP
jgi:membrane-associated phospholipid phosphatase